MDEIDVLVALAGARAARARASGRRRSRREPLDLVVARGCSRARTATAARDGGSRSRAPGRSRRSPAGRAGASAAAGCRPRGSRASASTPSPSASGPRCASSASVCSGVTSQTPARFFDPASVSTSSPPSSKRSRNTGVFGPLLARREVARPAGAHQVDPQHELVVVGREEEPLAASPRAREAAGLERDSGGSNVFSVAMCAGPACSIGAARHERVELAHPRLDLG